MAKNNVFLKGLDWWWCYFTMKNSNDGDNYETQYKNVSMTSWWKL